MTVKRRAAHPKLRPLDLRPHTQNGRQYYLLRDPLQLSDNMLLVPQPLAAILAFCDGTRAAKSIAQAFHAHYGFPIGEPMVAQLLEALDEACLLDNERSKAALHNAREQFRAAPFRPMFVAGGSYPADPDLLHTTLERYRSLAHNGSGPYAPLTPTPAFGLLSPHIDYLRGGVVYAQVWERAAQAVQEAELVILFGTDHYGSDSFTLTRQSYATPYGVLPTALDIVDELASVIGEEAAFAGELRHGGEHSLELVAVWLHHLRERRPVEVVPILCGGFHRFYSNGDHPDQDAQIERVLDTLRAASAGRKTVVVASGDLAHVGVAFGQDEVDDGKLALVQAADNVLIQQMTAGNATGFYRAIHAIRDENNVCGVAPIYLTLRLLGAVKGTLAGYATCPADNDNTSFVTVGGVIWQG
jgi:MEMO1 family protein